MKRLYLEFLRELKVCGIIFAVFELLTLIATLLVYSEEISIPAEIICPFGYAVMLLGGIVFPMVAFSFLNKRNSADVFHSLPCSRKQLFCSAALAVFTYLFALLFTAYLISGIGYAFILHTYVAFSQLLCSFCVMLIGSLAVASATMIGVSISGTALGALAASLVICYVPRGILTTFAYQMAENDLLSLDCLGILSPQYNIPFVWVGSCFAAVMSNASLTISRMIDQVYSFGLPMLYTLLLAGIYFVIAGYLFCRRKSESAGNSSVNGWVQGLIRCGVTMPVVLFLAIIASYRDFGTLFWVVLLAALGVYAIYELVTRKSVKKMFKTLPLFAAVVLVTLGLSTGAVALGNHMAERKVSAAGIQSVTFEGDTSMYPMDESYQRIKYGRIAYTNDAIKEIVADALSRNVDSEKNGIPTSNDGYDTLRVKIRLAHGSMTRYLTMTNSEYQQLIALTSTDEQVDTYTSDLPTADQLNKISVGLIGFDELQVPEEEVWNLLREDYLALTPQQKRDYFAQRENIIYGSIISTVKTGSVVGEIDASGTINGKSYTISFMIDTAFFPNTAKCLLASDYSEQQVLEGANTLLQLCESGTQREILLTYYAPDGSSYEAATAETYGYSDEDMQDSQSWIFDTEKVPEGVLPWDALRLQQSSYMMTISQCKEMAKQLLNGAATTPQIETGYYLLEISGYTDENYSDWISTGICFSLNE